MRENPRRKDALAIWQAGVDAVKPRPLIESALRNPEPELRKALDAARRILIVGGGKAGAGMAAGVEAALADRLDRVESIVNVPDNMVMPLKKIKLHAARPPGKNEPTEAGVVGTEMMLKLLREAGTDDLAICLLSGGGSALMPSPVEGVSLEDKQIVTRLLSDSGADITELNCVRKHLSRVKGGGLAATCRAGQLWSFIISDVIGDPLDVIASGPTAADATTFSDAINVLKRHKLEPRIPPVVREYLNVGAAHGHPETLKRLLPRIQNRVIGSIDIALGVARQESIKLGYRTYPVGGYLSGEASQEASFLQKLIRENLGEQSSIKRPCCFLFGGESVVSLPPAHGLGGRNQELVLATVCYVKPKDWAGVVILSGGTDGEDGPTDAAGAVADEFTLQEAKLLDLDPVDFLRRHDSYSFFEAVGGLIKTGLTGTNVMDIGLILIDA